MAVLSNSEHRIRSYFVIAFFLCFSISEFSVSAAQSQDEGFQGRRMLLLDKEKAVKKNSSLLGDGDQFPKPVKSVKTLNSTTKPTPKSKSLLKDIISSPSSSKPAKSDSISAQKWADLNQSSNPKNKTTKKKKFLDTQEVLSEETPSSVKKFKDLQKKQKNEEHRKIKQTPAVAHPDHDEDEDFMAIIPDLKKISTSSRSYIHREIIQTFKPIVGVRYASPIATITSCIFLFLPLLLVSLLLNQIRNCLPLQTVLVYIQAYLAIYFSILSLAYLATGLEPLRFFYATSAGSYAAVQVLQTLGYSLYLLMQLLDLVMLLSGKEKAGFGVRMLGLGQTFVGLAVGLHYYATVFHRTVEGKPPRTNWKIHGVYALCFLVISLFARVERRKKAYLLAGGEDDEKKS